MPDDLGDLKVLNAISTGTAGLDTVLMGGLPPNRLYLLEGAPGSGKTTLGLRFLIEGARKGESVLYITLSETMEELQTVAQSHGWTLDGIDVFELSAIDEALSGARDQSVLHPWETELGDTIKLIQSIVEKTSPRRVVFDSLSEMRLLSQDPLRYRRQILALKQYFVGRAATVLLVDDLTAGSDRDAHLHSLCHGVISLERLTLDFGSARRRLQVQKLRGVQFTEGFHDFVIQKGGLKVFPRLLAADFHRPFVGEAVPSGVSALDALLGGGPLRGTSTLITGPAGSGKTTIALQYVYAACERGENAAIFEFDERIGTLLVRAKSMGLDLEKHARTGRLTLRQIDPAEISPGEFATMVREEVEDKKCRIVVIDSLNGYLASMPQEQHLILQIHELLSYLNQQGVVTLMINPQHGLVGTMSTGSLNTSYVSDAIILIRFFEAQGRIRKAISIIKNRGDVHEDTIRELRIDSRGIRFGDPLTDFIGVMTGTPKYTGTLDPLLEDRSSVA